jgi:hypothetical protein
MKSDNLAECSICAKPFVRQKPLQAVCSFACAVKVSRQAKKARQEVDKGLREAFKERKERAKTRGDWLKETQTAINAYVRVRDKDLPCVSCGRHHDGQWHAGHYLSTGARPELRFDERNIHKQCQPCNTHLHGNLLLYRVELIRRIGLEEVERLEGPQTPKKYTIPDLKQIRDEYREKLRNITKSL